ncbi:hypothetical protein T4D_11143 [Trichinella pseudospiralis]|uniref:Uncharacterized protein n=1 Tax=Trichinella pseudospiralis TaxID=6337 RepID=A0A0V1F5X6_TRIPS|nr:hypothetical protein T4D_11143 [Trichinella pseudospiralis]
MVSADRDDHSGHRCPTGVRAVEIYLKLFLTFATHYAKILVVHCRCMWISACRMWLQYFLIKTTAYVCDQRTCHSMEKWVALMAMSQANLPKLATITASIANRAEFSKVPYQLLSEKNSRTSSSRLEQLPMVRVVGVILVNIAFIVKLTSNSRTRPWLENNPKSNSYNPFSSPTPISNRALIPSDCSSIS